MADTLPEDFRLATRHIVMERDLNAAGNLFGGTMLAWLDEATAISVIERIGYSDFVTVAMDNVNFKAPGHRGDLITFYSRVVKTGSSSIVAETRAYVEDHATGARREVITCRITYVCLKDQQPYAYFKSPEYAGWRARQTQ
ncbi:MAG: acyl-CoA thioesterase [Candidatus Hydrogenedentes bacterium]|nr:acyl-CoA thioesterase [Candidatus Hydrogenedentota bacterium]